MIFDTIHSLELDLIQKLQVIRSPLLDQFMLFCNYFDTNYFYFILLPCVWFLYSRSLGKEVFYSHLIACILTPWLKTLFGQPRPCQLIPEMALLYCTSFGFPSGAALVATSVFGLLAARIRKWGFTLFCVLFLLLVGASRVYLGMHFFTDVLGGYFFGGLAAMLVLCYSAKVEEWFCKKWSVLLVAALLYVVFYFIAFKVRSDLTLAFGITCGLWISQYQNMHIKVPKDMSLRLLQAVLVIVPLFISFSLVPYHRPFYFISALWWSYGIERLFSRIKNA